MSLRPTVARLCALLSFVLVLGATPAPKPPHRPPARPHRPPPPLRLTSQDFVALQTLDTSFTYNQDGCDGSNQVPQLAWTGIPPKTRSFAIILTDADAYPSTFYHWLRVDIPRSITHLPPDDDDDYVGLDARNSYGNAEYDGPCPPRHEAPHRYVFTLYALSVPKLPHITDKSTVLAVMHAMRGRILASTELAGRYGR